MFHQDVVINIPNLFYFTFLHSYFAFLWETADPIYEINIWNWNKLNNSLLYYMHKLNSKLWTVVRIYMHCKAALINNTISRPNYVSISSFVASSKESCKWNFISKCSLVVKYLSDLYIHPSGLTFTLLHAIRWSRVNGIKLQMMASTLLS